MKKILIGMVIGFILSFSFTAYAAEIKDIVGRKIQGMFPVKIDGKMLEVPAIVIDGTSYLPLKLTAQTLGYDVSFDKVKGIELKSKGGETVATQGTKEWLIEKIKTAQVETNYKVKSKSLPIEKAENRFTYLELDGNSYMDLVPISEYVQWKESKLIVKLPDRETIEKTVAANQAYTKDIDVFIFKGRIYAEYSAIGLTTTLVGDTVWIELK